jgi:hypothetical protein
MHTFTQRDTEEPNVTHNVEFMINEFDKIVRGRVRKLVSIVDYQGEHLKCAECRYLLHPEQDVMNEWLKRTLQKEQCAFPDVIPSAIREKITEYFTLVYIHKMPLDVTTCACKTAACKMGLDTKEGMIEKLLMFHHTMCKYTVTSTKERTIELSSKWKTYCNEYKAVRGKEFLHSKETLRRLRIIHDLHDEDDPDYHGPRSLPVDFDWGLVLPLFTHKIRLHGAGVHY